MSVSRPARCIFAQPGIPTIRPLRCRNFHTSPNLAERRRPKTASVKAVDLGLVSRDRKPAKELFPAYSKEEKVALAKRYTPAQLKAIEAGEAAISAEDLDKRGVVRTDMGALPYLDDFSQYRTILDKKPPPEMPIDPKARMTTHDEFASAFVKWLDKYKELEPPGISAANTENYHEVMRPNKIDFMGMTQGINAMTGSKGVADAYPVHQFVPNKEAKSKEDLEEEAREKQLMDSEDANDERDPDGTYNQLRKHTGLELDEILSLTTKILVAHRVVNQTRLGKIASIYVLAIAGNGKGRLGIGQAKGQEAINTQSMAKINAIRNMQPIARYEERTIFGEVEGKVSAAEVKLMSRPPGFGLRCQHNIFEMARAAGIQDLAARVPRSRNKMNTIKAAFQALTNQRLPDDIARGRGKKMVDVRKVYYGGRV